MFQFLPLFAHKTLIYGTITSRACAYCLHIVMESLVRQTNGIFGIGQMNDALAIQKGNVGTLI
jgi:hypothetical protein